VLVSAACGVHGQKFYRGITCCRILFVALGAESKAPVEHDALVVLAGELASHTLGIGEKESIA
jgi:hypothetical protein